MVIGVLFSLLLSFGIYFISPTAVFALTDTNVICNTTQYPNSNGCPTGQLCRESVDIEGERTCWIPGSSTPVIREVEEFNEARTAAETGKMSVSPFVNTSLEAFLVSTGDFLCGSCIGVQPKTGSSQTSSGVFGSLVSYIGDMYQSPPATTEAYVADLMQDMNIAQPAYAQGLGFSALNPILEVWKTMRNLAYFFFVVIFVVIGFMIMFRQKIGGQAVVTAQQAIPSIIISLVAVTFSYAIAGLLIDAMYLVMFLLAGVFARRDLIDGNVFQIAQKLISSNVAGSSANAVGGYVEAALGGGVVGTVAGAFGTITAAVVILVVILFNTFSLFIKLLRVYVELILTIAFAPLTLMMGAIPGRNPLGEWVRNIVGNLAVFPVILLLLIIFDVIRDAVDPAVGGGFIPPYTAGSAGAGFIPFLAGLGLILALPNAVDETKKALGVKGGGLFGTLVETGLKNFGKGYDLGIPVLGGALNAGVQVPRTIGDSMKTDLSWRERLSRIRGGYDIYDDEGKKIGRRQGLAESFGRGMSGGQSLRRTGQRIIEGRLGDPEDIQQYLAGLAKQQVKPKEPVNPKAINKA